MAIVYNEQTRLWQADPGGTDTWTDDGAPMHAALVHDMPRVLNNLATYVEPCFQFVCPSSIIAGVAFNGPQWWRLDTTNQPASGYAWLGTFPYILPVGNKRIFWTFSAETDNLSPPPGLVESSPTLSVTGVRIYLSSTPPKSFASSPDLYHVPAYTYLESYTTSDSSFPGGFISHELTAAPTVTLLGGAVNYNVWTDTSTGWLNWYQSGATFVPGGDGEVCAYCTIAVAFSGAVQYDRIKAKEFSIWGVPE